MKVDTPSSGPRWRPLLVDRGGALRARLLPSNPKVVAINWLVHHREIFPSLLPNDMSRSVLLGTANAVIEGYNTWKPEALVAYRAPNCVHQVLPASLGRQPLNNEQYLAFLTPIMPAFKNVHMTVRHTIVDEEARKVAMHVSSTAKTDLGDYGNEYILVLHMTEDGEKVVRFEEFVDSKYSEEFMPRLKEHLVGKQKKA